MPLPPTSVPEYFPIAFLPPTSTFAPLLGNVLFGAMAHCQKCQAATQSARLCQRSSEMLCSQPISSKGCTWVGLSWEAMTRVLW
jgi:hypothetical protein